MSHSARTYFVLLLAVMLTSTAIHADEDTDAPVAIGSAAPDFTITSQEGEFTLSSLKGAPDDGGNYTVLVFVRAHW